MAAMNPTGITSKDSAAAALSAALQNTVQQPPMPLKKRKPSIAAQQLSRMDPGGGLPSGSQMAY